MEYQGFQRTQTKNNATLVSEVFYPTTVATGQISSHGTMNMDIGGFKYTMATVMKLDLNGKMIWNACFPMPINEKSYANYWRNVFDQPPVMETHLRLNKTPIIQSILPI